MYSNDDFAHYIFENKSYISFPEIVEFYRGIARDIDDILVMLTKDLNDAIITVDQKVGLPKDMNPFDVIKWRPTDESILKVKSEIGDGVNRSKLPKEIKDNYADRGYDYSKPYNQTVQKIMEEYSLSILIHKIRASSVALRNSDYASPESKKNLLKEIMKAWEELSKVLIALTPILANNGAAVFDGAGFILAGNSWGDTFEQRLNKIVQCNPTNVICFFKDYLSSNKMGPLLYEMFKNEERALPKHELALFLVYERPNGWKNMIGEYISSIHKNSFYLFDIINSLRSQYRYSFSTQKELNEMEYLIKMGFAKHEKGIKSPGRKSIENIPSSVIPQRK